MKTITKVTEIIMTSFIKVLLILISNSYDFYIFIRFHVIIIFFKIKTPQSTDCPKTLDLPPRLKVFLINN